VTTTGSAPLQGRRFPDRATRARLVPPQHVYPVDEWRLVEKRFSPRFLAQTETVFALSNGYLGLRGDFEEGAPLRDGGAYLNGFHETWPIVYGEEAYGFANTGQTIVNVPDGKIIRLYVDDEPFDLEKAHLIEFQRVLDLKAGTLNREILWETPSGKRIAVKSRRFVSVVHRHLAVLEYEVTVLDDRAHLLLSSELVNRFSVTQKEGDDPRKARRFDGSVLEPLMRRSRDQRALLCYRTRSSRLELACGMDHTVETECAYDSRVEDSEHVARIVLSVEAEPGRAVHLTKYLAYHYGVDVPPDELCVRTERTLGRAVGIGREQLFEEQRERVDDFWRRSDVRVEGHPATQQLVRFNLFELFQATARVEGHGVPAKGLTGRGYEGHYFWDAEIYVMPFLTYTAPNVARSLLHFRYGMLEHARARAAELGHRGALYPWRTISGQPASAYYAAGTAQYHINADIMYALRKYVAATGDLDLMRNGGAEMLVETARMWVDLGCYPEVRDGAFSINGVTGPDEYTAVVNNNRFTNMMARDNLRSAIRVVEMLRESYPTDFAHLVDETGLDLSELAEWQRAMENMCLPIDEKTGIHPQDDSFLEKEVWDFENTPPEKYPLLLHHHPLVLYRHQVIKQADVVLAMFLLDRDFSLQEKKRNFDYYDPLTTRDSSLSSCIESIVACEIGYAEKALDYFLEAAMMDLADVGGNVNDGVHIASAGGVWMALVYGFAGMRDEFGVLSFHPRLPEPWERLRFPLTVGGQILDVDITRDSVTYALRDGQPLSIRHEEGEIQLEPGRPVSARCQRPR
jgi:alpha,alpha-trehalose phosphorylase